MDKYFRKGDSAKQSKVISERDITLFAEVTGDLNPLHLDQEFASKTRFKERIAHGLLGAGLISAVLGNQLPGPGSIYLNQSLRFTHPIKIGDLLTAEVRVKNWNEAKKIIDLDTYCINQNNIKVITGEASLLVD